MNDVPFGFGPAGRDPERRDGDPSDPASMFAAMFGQMQQMMSGAGGGPVNWTLARQVADQTISGANPGVSPSERAAVREAIELADLWLNEVTDLPSGVRAATAWTRSEWIENTLPGWSELCEPVAERVGAAMTQAIPQEQMAMFGDAGPLNALMTQVGGMVFGAQVGQGIGGLATEVVSASDIGVPLSDPGTAALVPANVAAFGEGLERPEDEVRLYLALREAAHQRLFSHVPWLRQRLTSAIDDYARGFTIDMSALEQAVGSVDPTDAQSLQDALSGGMFEPAETPEQQAALRRVETLLALVEGWVDSVVASAAGERMPGATALREATRRRRATGGPAEQTFATLVGLELRPRRLREAAALWWAVTEKHGVSGRDALWAHPDLMPGSDDLDDPIGFAETLGNDPMAELTDDLINDEVLGEAARDVADSPDGGTPDQGGSTPDGAPDSDDS